MVDINIEDGRHTWEDGRYMEYNIDMEGFVEEMRRNNISLSC